MTTFGHAGEPVSLERFLGPRPGDTYRYRDERSGGTMVRKGVQYNDAGGILVHEVVTAPWERVLFDGYHRKIDRRYVLYVSGSRLMQQPVSKGGSIQDRVCVDVGSTTWGNPVIVQDSGEKMLAICKVISVTRQVVFGKERLILEVDGKHCVPSKYASGIGLIEEAGMRLVDITSSEAN